MSDLSPLPEDEYLDAAQIVEFKGMLEVQLERLIETARGRVKEVTEERSTDADTLDFAASETNRDAMLRMADRERRLMKKVQFALKRINDGEYGSCQSCGGPIAYARLLARPVASLCIDCKTEAEQLEGSRGPTF